MLNTSTRTRLLTLGINTEANISQEFKIDRINSFTYHASKQNITYASSQLQLVNTHITGSPLFGFVTNKRKRKKMEISLLEVPGTIRPCFT
jgi:hypothetical protein